MAQDTRQHTEHRDFASPDEVRAFGHGRLELPSSTPPQAR